MTDEQKSSPLAQSDADTGDTSRNLDAGRGSFACPICGVDTPHRHTKAEQLVAECAPFLKDGETPAKCIARNRADATAAIRLYYSNAQRYLFWRNLHLTEDDVHGCVGMTQGMARAETADEFDKALDDARGDSDLPFVLPGLHHIATVVMDPMGIGDAQIAAISFEPSDYHVPAPGTKLYALDVEAAAPASAPAVEADPHAPPVPAVVRHPERAIELLKRSFALAQRVWDEDQDHEDLEGCAFNLRSEIQEFLCEHAAERELFHAWCREQGIDYELWMPSQPWCGYHNGRTQDVWLGWLGRAALASGVAPKENT